MVTLPLVDALEVVLVWVEPLLLLFVPPSVPVLELLLHASAPMPSPRATMPPKTQAIFTDFITSRLSSSAATVRQGLVRG